MGYFGKSSKQDAASKQGISTAKWRSIASGYSALESDDIPADNNEFVHPDGSGSSAWTKERQSQQLDLEDVHNSRKAGRCSKCLGHLIKGLHVIDASMGIAMIVYGSLLCTQFDEPAMAAVLVCLLMGGIHVATSAFAIVSYATKRCSRCGLLVSAYTAPYIAMLHLTMIIALLFDSSGFFQYLNDHKEVMYLGENVVENMKRLMPLVYTVLSILTLLESLRLFVLKDVQKQLICRDTEENLIPTSGYNTVSSVNNTLTEALLEGNDTRSDAVKTGDEGGSAREVASTPDWWSK